MSEDVRAKLDNITKELQLLDDVEETAYNIGESYESDLDDIKEGLEVWEDKQYHKGFYLTGDTNVLIGRVIQWLRRAEGDARHELEQALALGKAAEQRAAALKKTQADLQRQLVDKTAIGKKLSALETDPGRESEYNMLIRDYLKRGYLNRMGAEDRANEAMKDKYGENWRNPRPRRLPIVSYNDVVEGLSMPGEKAKFVKPGDYYLDERLKELRSVKMPYATIRLNDFEVEYFKRRAK